jgi:ketosteroid isomerase-like protein
MSEQENAAAVQAIYAAFGRGDVAAVLDAMAEDVDWRFPGPAEVPYVGTLRGREQVGQFFGRLAGSIEIQQLEPREFVAQGDTVVVLGYERARVKTTGRTFEQEWAHVFTLRGGKVAQVRLIEDTAAIAAAFRGA